MVYIIDSDISDLEIEDEKANIEENYCFKDSFRCAFSSLTKKEQQVISLICQGYKYIEISKMLGISYAAAKRRGARAKGSFQSALSEQGISVK